MALVVEDGSGSNPSANSYAALAFLRAYNVDRGRAYASGDVNDATATAQAIVAMDYIEALEPEMNGSRVAATQPLAYPRNNVYLYGELFPSDEIPVQLQKAQAELAWQVKSGVILFPTTQGQPIKRKKTGPLEKEFFEAATLPSIPYVDQWLSVLLGGSPSALRVVRV